jgi:hypothetical protein
MLEKLSQSVGYVRSNDDKRKEINTLKNTQRCADYNKLQNLSVCV